MNLKDLFECHEIVVRKSVIKKSVSNQESVAFPKSHFKVRCLCSPGVLEVALISPLMEDVSKMLETYCPAVRPTAGARPFV